MDHISIYESKDKSLAGLVESEHKTIVIPRLTLVYYYELIEGVRMSNEDRGLCVKQPWAWFIVNGYKDIENRKNPPPQSRLGEKVLIVSSKRRLTKNDYEDFVHNCGVLGIKKYPKSIDEFHYGAIIGSVVIADYTHKSKSIWASKGACHWVLEKAKKMKPKPQKGQQTLFFKIPKK